jgi:hypothetical protein
MSGNAMMNIQWRDLPTAISWLDESKPVVRSLVLQDYANWKMENDCHQLPGDLALFLRTSIASNDLFVSLCQALVSEDDDV